MNDSTASILARQRFQNAALFVSMLLAVFPIFPPAASAQVDTIRRNPDAVQLQRIWMIKADLLSHDEVGGGMKGLGDVNGDGYGDFAVHRRRPDRWMVFHGHPTRIDTTPAQEFPGYYLVSDNRGLAAGNFWGNGERGVAMVHAYHDSVLQSLVEVHVFRIRDGRIDTVPTTVWSGVRRGRQDTITYLSELKAADLDGDGDDELFLSSSNTTYFPDSTSSYGRLLIFEGGQGFDITQPTSELRSRIENRGPFAVHVGKLDRDSFPDLLTVSQYFGIYHYEFYWGEGRLPTTSAMPDRHLERPSVGDYSIAVNY
jgi:hypothetical protein